MRPARKRGCRGRVVGHPLVCVSGVYYAAMKTVHGSPGVTRDKMLKIAGLESRGLIYGGVALFSFLLSIYSSATRDLINGDGILNVDVAKAFLVVEVGR